MPLIKINEIRLGEGWDGIGIPSRFVMIGIIRKQELVRHAIEQRERVRKKLLSSPNTPHPEAIVDFVHRLHTSILLASRPSPLLQ